MSTTRTHIYTVEETMKEMVNIGKSLTEDAIKQTTSLNSLANMDADDIKNYKSLMALGDQLDLLVKAYVEVLKSMDDRQTKVEDSLKEINRKLDRINNK